MSDLDNSTAHAIDIRTDLISDQILALVNTINLATLGASVALFGIVANVINIAIFVKQGFNDTVNIGLTALAASDLFSLIMQEWITTLNNPLFINNVPLILVDFEHLTACWPHVFFARISSWITVYITMERCLCVIVPLKIKTIITPRVTVCVIVFIFVIMFLSLIPDYVTYYIDWKRIPGTNKTLLALYVRDGTDEMAALSFTISAATQISSFVAVIFFTVILVTKMEQKSKWRMSTSSSRSDSSKETFNRDKRTVKMITLVAVIYCVCFLPMLCVLIAISIEPEFIIFGLYNNTFWLVWSFAFLLNSVNASVNIFVYYRMSTKYRKTFVLLIYKTVI